MAHYWRAALAQLVEQLSCKQQVIGSSPIGGSTEKRPRADESRRGAFCCARRYWRVGGFRSKAVDVLTLGRAGLVCGVFVLWVGAGGGLSGGLCCGRGRGWPVRGFVLCAGYWRVWRKALSACWGAVVRRGWGQWCFGPWRAMSWASRQGVGSAAPLIVISIWGRTPLYRSRSCVGCVGRGVGGWC